MSSRAESIARFSSYIQFGKQIDLALSSSTDNEKPAKKEAARRRRGLIVIRWQWSRGGGGSSESDLRKMGSHRRFIV